ncbi:VanW family protein [soil metagenome]
MSTRTRVLTAVAGVPVVLLIVLVSVWAVDTQGADDQVVRNVELAGRAIGGLERHQLEPIVAEVAERYPDATVRVETADGDLNATGEEMGLTLDQEATVEAALEVGRSGSVFVRPFAWLASLVAGRDAEVVVAADETMVRTVLAENDPTGRQAPVEPAISGAEGQITVIPGAPGVGLVHVEVAAAIPPAAADGELPIVIQAEPGTIDPQFGPADAEALAEEARALTEASLAIESGGNGAEVPPETLRTWLSSTATPEGLELVFDETTAFADLSELLTDAGERPVDAGFRVEGDTVIAVAGSTGTECCEEGAGQLVIEALASGGGGPVELPLKVVEPERTLAEAQALGVNQPIASFTTNFQAGQSRVNNIQLMADKTRGVVIEPGDTFSVNGYVGMRTRAKGFTPGGFINNGVLEEAIGGGVSQYATTLFNAAFFGGLEIPEYQSHSLYISRYPYGREATLSFPKPDLVIENSTPYGVLLWPTYTDSSITVTLSSTPYATGEQTGQTRSQAGNCTRVTTERNRTYVDGRTEVDTVFATYRPGEGVNC